jgi:hypothetical protein
MPADPDLAKPSPLAPTTPDGMGVPRIPIPPNTNPNPFDGAVQRIVKEASDGIARRDPTPFRERGSATPVDSGEGK